MAQYTSIGVDQADNEGSAGEHGLGRVCGQPHQVIYFRHQGQSNSESVGGHCTVLVGPDKNTVYFLDICVYLG